jgi:parallel beta-helix repeat protein
MKRLPVSLGVVMIAAAVSGLAHAAPVIRHVPADYPTIQSALNASVFNDVVLVAPGTYLENLTIGPAQNSVVLRSEAGAEVTTIDGQQLDRVINCFQVGSATSIEGFSIIHGRVGPNDTGGGLRLDQAHIRFVDNIVRDNVAGAGAGVFVDESQVQLIGNQIVDNQALASGGGIYLDHFSHALIEGNIIVGNTSGHHGGGISIWNGSRPRIVGNTILDNESALNGGGVHITRNAHPSVSRNIIAFNGRGNGIHLDDVESTVLLDCNDAWSNAPANYAGIPDHTGMDGNISEDPLFCDLAGRDFRLDERSPCAPDNSPAGCGLIGALDVGCGITAVEAATWGGIKARHLTERAVPAKTAEVKAAAVH